MSTTNHQHVRIADVNLDFPLRCFDGVKIRPALSKRPVVVSYENLLARPILTTYLVDSYPSSTESTREFLFALDSAYGPGLIFSLPRLNLSVKNQKMWHVETAILFGSLQETVILFGSLQETVIVVSKTSHQQLVW